MYIFKKIYHKSLIFDDATEEEFERVFLNVISRGSKDNTYKFALARFMLDYSNKHDSTKNHIDFTVIAEYFLQYYWTQICKLKMKHSPQVKKKPMIVQIIEGEFEKSYYPHTFKEIKEEKPEKIQTCIEKIVKLCFHNVIWRFQRIKVGRATEVRLFFDYNIIKTTKYEKFVDLEYGINLNPKAMQFFKRYNAVLLKAVILEWAKFLEKLNTGMPKIIIKTEGKNIKRTSLIRFKKVLTPHFECCFYCNKTLPDGRETHVEHVIPFDYIAEDDIWNLTLACQECNLRKLGSLPPREYIEKLIQRDIDYRGKIILLDKSLIRLQTDHTDVINNHYENAKSHGYMVLKEFP